MLSIIVPRATLARAESQRRKLLPFCDKIQLRLPQKRGRSTAWDSPVVWGTVVNALHPARRDHQAMALVERPSLGQPLGLAPLGQPLELHQHPRAQRLELLGVHGLGILAERVAVAFAARFRRANLADLD